MFAESYTLIESGPWYVTVLPLYILHFSCTVLSMRIMMDMINNTNENDNADYMYRRFFLDVIYK